MTDAALRPQAQSQAALEALTADLQESLRIARERGASVQVHCAADDHLWHSLGLPLADLGLTVHPICPRKPFARLLDKCKMLVPIILDVLHRLPRLSEPAKRKLPPAPFRALAACGGLLGGASAADAVSCSSEVPSIDPHGRVSVACWNWNPHGRTGGFSRYTVAIGELVPFIFGKPAVDMPRPGQWFCPKCRFRNVTDRFFCKKCLDDPEATMHLGSRVPDGTQFPRRGDWGCGTCGEAMCGYQAQCTLCSASKSGPHVVVVP